MSTSLSAVEFWSIIEEISDSDPEAIKQRLSTLTLPQVAGFSVAFQKYSGMLDSDEYSMNLPLSGNSYDAFLYVRNSVVLSGKKSFDGILKNPKKISKYDDIWSEFIDYICPQIYEAKFGLDHDQWSQLEESTDFESGYKNAQYRILNISRDTNDCCLNLAASVMEFHLKKIKVYFNNTSEFRLNSIAASELSFDEKIKYFYFEIYKLLLNSENIANPNDITPLATCAWHPDSISKKSFKINKEIKCDFHYDCKAENLIIDIRSLGRNLRIICHKESLSDALSSFIKPIVMGSQIHIKTDKGSDFYYMVNTDLSSYEYRNYRADEGHPHMMCRLGEYLIKKDLEKAKYWLTLSSNNGFNKAKSILEKLEFHGNTEPPHAH